MEPELFSQKPPEPEEHLKKQSAQEQAVSSVSKNLTALGSRLRVLEEQYSSVRNKSQLTDQNMLEFEKDTNEELRHMSEEMLDIKGMLQKLKEKIEIINSELANTVKEHDLKVLEKYVDLWNPSRFITKDALREKLEEHKEKSLNSGDN